MKRLIQLLALLLVSIALAACGKIAEKATEKLAEKALESQSKDGSKASINLSEGSAKVTTTDASGKSSTMEWGGAKVTESDLGVPFYAGAKITEGASSKVVTPEATVMMASLQSSDSSEKVTAFYREKLKPQSQDKQFMEMSTGDGGYNLMLADKNSKNSTQVNVSKTDSGSDINIIVSRDAAK
ncbi:MAG: hypothetical protein H6R18_59 [Proteobacteria bacterium]|nr:hypothetical protein [Pseudomonadota bacterium]